VSGDVVMNSVNGPFVLVNSNSGKIHYDGEFGGGGEYSLTSHTGDIEALAPSYASIDVTARSEQGKVEMTLTVPCSPGIPGSRSKQGAPSRAPWQGRIFGKVVFHLW